MSPQPRISAGDSRRLTTVVVRRWVVVASTVALLSALLPASAAVAAPAATVPTGVAAPAALSNHLTLRVVTYDASLPNAEGAAIPTYRFLIVRDDTGDTRQPEAACFPTTNPDYPTGCDWPSIHATRGGTAAVDQMVTSGDESVLNTTVGLDLPSGKYVISVLAPDHKIDGAHFTMPIDGALTVAMQPYPLPLATIRIEVFNDNTMVNAQWDELTEEGLVGFVAHISDVLGEVTTDWYGNPLCTEYVRDPVTGKIVLDAGGRPTPIPGTGGRCVSQANADPVLNGQIVIPNLGPNRYSVTVVPPTGQTWIQTTTLEGSLDWDQWTQEGDRGYDTEVVVGGEPVPIVPFGFVRPMNALPSTATGVIRGSAMGIVTFVPPAGGIASGGEAGSRETGPVSRPWVALNDLLAGDTQIYLARGNLDGTFEIPHVPDGDYGLAVFDGPLDYIMEGLIVTIRGGQTVDVGKMYMSHWFTIVDGHIFVDTNANGVRDVGEPGLPNQGVVLKSRDNSLQDQGAASATTDINGHYTIREAYPLGQWVVEEVYNDRYYTTGITFQADNQPDATTVLGAGVDVSTFPLVGHATRIDWGVRPYEPGTNGGIVGTVVYATTRNELDARLAAAEDYEAGVSGLTVNLYTTVKDANGVALREPDGSYTKGSLVNRYTTEQWERPINCIARDVNNLPQSFPWTPTKPNAECLEGFAMGAQVQTDFSLVNGNYGFGDGCFGPGGATSEGVCADGSEPTALALGDYLVEVQIPDDAYGRPKYKLVKEEDVNVFDGDQFVPQVPPPACAGALHTVDVAGVLPDGPNAVSNPAFADGGGSPYEGVRMPLCDVRVVTVSDMKSIAPLFYIFTDVPVPGRFRGIVTDDLALSTNPRELYVGEKAGIPHMPIGLYDFSGRLVHTMETDFNGAFEVILPSVSSYNCPLPAGPCPNVYRFVANDPGTPTKPNANYNPAYRVIATPFQLWPNLTLPADLAPVPISQLIEGPGTQANHPPECAVASTVPQLFRVDKPYVNGSGSIHVTGASFGGVQGVATLDGIAVPTSGWTDTSLDVNIPGSTPPGPHQLHLSTAAGGRTLNGITVHVLGGSYAPSLFEVGPTYPFATIQAALEAAATPATRQSLVVVYPGTPATFNPLGAYFENVVVHSRVKLQGVGPGNLAAGVAGSIIDGSAFNTVVGQANAWLALVAGLPRAGNQAVYQGEVIFVAPQTTTQFSSTFATAIDGFTLQGGNQLMFPANIPDTTGQPPEPVDPAAEAGIVQGGAIYVNGYAHSLRVTNNVIESNGGTYGGALRLGTPDIGDNHNDNVRLLNNRIMHNGGINLAGAIALFNGSDGYEIAENDICGNFSTEYGGGISHFGLSPNGSIHHNRIYFNGSYDEGAGILIAGEPPANPATTLSLGSGPVNIHDNVIQGNLANDDGGGLRFLEAGNDQIDVYNNFINNNISTHEGGGAALDDSTNVRFFNNTVMKNLTTATAVDSNGLPMPAGLSDTQNSDLLQATLPAGHAIYGDPLLFNNIFFDNRAGTWDGANLLGIGATGDTGPTNHWDLGTSDNSGLLHPTYSIIQEPLGTVPDASNHTGAASNPLVVDPFELTVSAFPWVGNPSVVGTIIIAIDVPPELMGNYHLQQPSTSSPAHNTGTPSKAGVFAPHHDIDGDYRPAFGAFEIGADEDPGDTPDATAPVVSGLGLTPNPLPTGGATTLTGNASDVGLGDSNIDSAEWRDGLAGSWNPMTASDGSFNSTSEGIQATITTTGWALGVHHIDVRATDAASNVSVIVTTDLLVTAPPPPETTPPVVTGLAFTANPVAAGTGTTLNGNASDVGLGNSNIGSAEWRDGPAGSWNPMTASDGSFNSASEGIQATIATTGWAVGPHHIGVRATDALSNVSAIVTIDLTVSAPPDLLGPLTTTPLIFGSNPNFTIGAITSDLGRGVSNIAAAEWFEGTAAPGAGHPMTALFGGFNNPTEIISAPFNTTGWTPGVHMLRVRGRDAAGNWGPPSNAAAITIAGGLARAVANPITVDNFATGAFTAWSAVVGSSNLRLRAAAGLDGNPGLAIVLARGVRAYLVDTAPVALNTYHARFQFNPHGAVTGNLNQVLFRGLNARRTTVFELQYRHVTRGSYLVRVLVRGATGVKTGSWISIGNRTRALEIAWSAGRRGGLSLYVDGRLRSRWTTNTSRLRLEEVQLGLLAPLSRSSGTEYVDGFVSSRTTFIGR